MTSRHLWYVPGIIVALLVVAVLVLLGSASRISASVSDATVSPSTIGVGETATLTVQTVPGGRTVQASIDAGSAGSATFNDTGTTDAEEVSSSGYTGTATFTVSGTAEGQVTINVTDSSGGSTQSVTLTVEAEGTGDFIDPPGTQPGIYRTLWGGGTIEQVMEAAPDALFIWGLAPNGRFFCYVPAAPAFVNAVFLTGFPGGLIPPNTLMVVVIN